MKKKKTIMLAISTLSLFMSAGCSGSFASIRANMNRETTDTYIYVNPFDTTDNSETEPETTDMSMREETVTEESTAKETERETSAAETTICETSIPSTEQEYDSIDVDRMSTLRYLDISDTTGNRTVWYKAHDNSNILYLYSDDCWLFWNFSDKGIVGIGKDSLNAKSYSNSISNSENVAFTEMYAGFTAEIEDGRYLKVNNYYNEAGITCINTTLTFMDGSIPRYTRNLNKDLTADLFDASYTNGFYVITATYTWNGSNYVANLYLYINCSSNLEADFNAYICDGCISPSHEKDHMPGSRQRDVQEMIEAKGITPENSLDCYIAYPYEAPGQSPENYVLDTYFWINKADEIISGNEDSSQAYKALLLHDWMTENLIFDSYKANYLENPRYYGHYDTGKYYVSECNVGVCRDYVNIYAIMCRRCGIPCIILGNSAEGHVWNAVYLYDRWLEVDITCDIERYALTADATDVTEATVSNTHCYTDFCNWKTKYYMPTASEVNKWLHPM